MLRVGGSVFRCPWNLESWGSRCKSRSVLVRATAVPVSKDLPGAREYASNGLFGLRFMGGPCFLQGCLLRQRGEAGASGVRSTLGKGGYTGE